MSETEDTQSPASEDTALPDLPVLGDGEMSRLPNGLTRREEEFCIGYVNNGGHNLKKVYIEAGYKDPGSFWNMKVKKLLAKDKVKQRIAELKENPTLNREMTKEVYIATCMRLHDKAKEDGAYKDAATALELVGKAKGFLVDTKVNMNANMTPKNAVSPEERKAKIAAMAALAGFVPAPAAQPAVDAEFTEVKGE